MITLLTLLGLVMTKKRNRPYLPNNWKELSRVPASFFESITFDEFMDWKVAGWALPSSVSCILRVTDVNTKKVKEYTYQRRHAAEKKVKQLMEYSDKEFIICDSDNIHVLYPKD